MQLLVVVEKLLTGFDAPSCTYLYIDKKMQDHGLFQAICRTNRLDGEDKLFGNIVDFKDLFKKVEKAIAVYSSELDHSAPGAEPEIFMQNRLDKGRERLESAIEILELICEPVLPPKGDLEYIHYFCGNSDIVSDLKEREPQRATLYKATANFVRSYANISDELEATGYNQHEISRIKRLLEHYIDLRDLIWNASGESLDMKPYEADMRFLIDNYIEAKIPRKISPFDDNQTLLDLIVKSGVADAVVAKLNRIRSNKHAISESIENNIRSKIIKEHLNDPAYYEKMSALLDEIIIMRKSKAIEYEDYLNRIAELAKNVQTGHVEEMPERLDTPGKRALYSNLGQDEILALQIDEVVKNARQDDWRGAIVRERIIQRALYSVLQDEEAVERIFRVIKAQREY